MMFFVSSKRSLDITMTSTGYCTSPSARRMLTLRSRVLAGSGSTTSRSRSLSSVIWPVAADPNRMILSGRATVSTRRTTSLSSVSSTFIQFHHTQSRPRLHERYPRSTQAGDFGALTKDTAGKDRRRYHRYHARRDRSGQHFIRRPPEAGDSGRPHHPSGPRRRSSRPSRYSRRAAQGHSIGFGRNHRRADGPRVPSLLWRAGGKPHHARHRRAPDPHRRPPARGRGASRNHTAARAMLGARRIRRLDQG